MYYYLAYGLGIHSQFKLFDLPPYDVEMDVVIQNARIDFNNVDEDAPRPYLLLTPKEAILSIVGVGRFNVRNGNHIIVDPHPDADYLLVQRYIVGICMALLLYQRGQLVLHASAVNIEGRGIAFLGASGAGKSSIAATFLASGHMLLVDDIVSVIIENNVPYLFTGFPYIKLDNETPALAELRKDKLEFTDYLENKAGFRIVDNASSNRVPLNCIYIINDGDHFDIQRYDIQKSLIELVRYSIPSSMVKIDKASHFKRCVDLVNLVPVFKLIRPTNLDRLPELVNHIESHITINI